ncbi:hypothetical protein ACIRPN_33010 [Streptomyces sp. NPDC101230]|uniref:hypothetical protein n=1 Tax=unclassified Streptomyces TaxID=2593676 RepID=UPI00381F5894
MTPLRGWGTCGGGPARTVSGKRFEAAPGVTLSSVVFRSSGRDLTAASICIGMASRVIEPVLLGLAGVAVRDRVKR